MARRKASLLSAHLTQATAQQHTYPDHPHPGGPDQHLVLTFTPPGPALSMNTTNKHWAALRADRQAWKTAAYLAACEADNQLAAFRGHRVEITVALPVPDNRRRDPHNYVETIKRIIDGIVNSGAVIPDDNATWCAVPEPVLYRGDSVRIRIRTAPPAEDPDYW